MSAELVVDCACDEHGKRMFTTDDVPVVAQMPHRIINQIVDAIDANNRLGPVDDEMDDAAKNSESAPSV